MQQSPWPRFLAHALVAALGAALVFLWVADFFAAWDGRAVSARPADPDQASRSVLIVEEGRDFERRWPAALVDALALPVDAQAIAPAEVPPERPATLKRRFTLTFSVQAPDGARTVPTTSPQALGVGLVVFVLAIALRNMAVGGAPWLVAPSDRYRPPVQTSGQVVSKTYSTSKKTPPPGRPQRGRGRRG